MKKKWIQIGLFLLLVTAAGTMAFQPDQERNKQNGKGQEKKAGKPDNPGKSQAAKNNKSQQGKGNNDDNRGRNKQEKGNRPGNAGKGNNSNEAAIARSKRVVLGNGGYEWDRETFRDREKYRKQDKVTICHTTGNGGVTISVAAAALKAHMDHGDVQGECRNVRNDRYSETYIRERDDYYERIEESREKVLYSQSILDYAVQRLTDSRLQLADMRTRNLPAAEIQQKEATVLELEENVSLLETLVGVAANLLANRL